MNYVGDYTAGDIVYIYFNTFDSNDPSASVTMTNFVNTDVHIHKNADLTQRNNAAGVTVDVDVDGITGCHLISIDTADNTVADFFVSGADYGVRIEGVTVDAATLNPFIGHFSIENRHVAGSMARTTIATLASQTSFTLTAGSADDDAYNKCTVIVTDIASAIQKAVGRISDYTGSTKTVTLAADPGIFTMAASDRIHIIATSALANIASSDDIDLTATQKTSVNTEADTALTDYNGPTSAELVSEIDAVQTDIAALNDLSTAQVNTEADTALSDFFTSAATLVNLIWDEAMVETTGAPAITGTMRAFMEFWAALSRNKMLQTATTSTLRNDADSADLSTSTVSDDATTFTRGEWST
jgi:hypothetical protein